MKQRIELFQLGFLVLISAYVVTTVNSSCNTGCKLALASYNVWQEANITFIAKVFASDLIDTANQDFPDILGYNPDVTSKDSIQFGSRINVPFPCDCLENSNKSRFLGHTFKYPVNSGDTYVKVAHTYYANLTTVEYLQSHNRYPPNRIPDSGAVLDVTVNCSCGDADVSEEYGLFVTYPLKTGESLKSVAQQTGVEESLLQRYNPGVDFSSGSGIVYVPGKDRTGSYPKLKTSKGIAPGVIAGTVVAVIASVLLLGSGVYILLRRNKKLRNEKLLQTSQELSKQVENVSSVPAGMTVDKSVEFSYEELAQATDNFSLANKIGQGGFGAVYYAELRGEKAAIKKMDLQQSKEFYAELKVLTRVHHVNLVRLIGYCVEGAFILVYEYIENGNLSEHLRKSGRSPLPWSTRVQIALDSARGLEYIHEHTVPVYIHRDIKSANILIDENFRGKVADFGLARLTEVAATTRLAGTFGYMPPEYVQFGDVTAKVDVFAFGVVLYELISAKDAIVKPNDPSDESKGLVAMFDEAFDQPDPGEHLVKLVDSRLADNYSFDELQKMARIAKACTNENPQLRPSMRSVVVDLMTLSSSTRDWGNGATYENESIVSLMSGR